MGVGMPADLLLHEFGSQVWAAFGDCPYHVGSSFNSKQMQMSNIAKETVILDRHWAEFH